MSLKVNDPQHFHLEYPAFLRQATEKVGQNGFDILLWRLPDITGWELSCKWMAFWGI
ncbi:hypothetical protein [uncultured Aquitalea sp.]|uniref:hypothetical protein n=1 Tax=uncultured Aquitalea sp. TaxID=540272 RepID=UPI0025F0430F|nr:hypothetical protein [uncultured Aquitalea sp.]